MRRTYRANQWPSEAKGHTRDFQLIFMKNDIKKKPLQLYVKKSASFEVRAV